MVRYAKQFTRYFFDTEFHEDGDVLELISIGIVSDDGRSFYAESSEVDLSKCNPWVQEHVIPYLGVWHQDTAVDPISRAEIATQIRAFVAEGDRHPQFWSYYADYDWVLFCRLFGSMIDLPNNWPMLCMDLKQTAMMIGDPKLPRQLTQEHHALADAEWHKEVYDFLKREYFRLYAPVGKVDWQTFW